MSFCSHSLQLKMLRVPSISGSLTKSTSWASLMNVCDWSLSCISLINYFILTKSTSWASLMNVCDWSLSCISLINYFIKKFQSLSQPSASLNHCSQLSVSILAQDRPCQPHAILGTSNFKGFQAPDVNL